MLAARLPPMSPAELLEVSMIASVAGELAGPKLWPRARPETTSGIAIHTIPG
jgi:predicted ATPase with chaperone activity